MFTKGYKTAGLQFVLAGILFVRILANIPGVSWNTFMGGIGYDEGLGIAVDANGNSYVVGYSQEAWGTPLQAHSGDYDAYITKFDSSGVREWHTFTGGSGWEFGEDIAVDPNGNIYITGVSTATWGTPLHAYVGFEDILVAKYSSDGALLWNTFLGGGSDDSAFGIALDADGNVYVTGRSEGSWDTEPLHAHAGGGDELFLAKLNNDGALQWHTFYGLESTEEVGYDLHVTNVGDIYVAGESDSNWGTPINPHYDNASSDIFVAKLLSDGSLQWNTFLGGEKDQRGASIDVDSNGNSYITGFSWNGWGTPLNPYGGGLTDAFVAKLDANGTSQWHTFLGGTADDAGADLVLDSNENLYVIGDSGSTWGTPINPFAGNYDAFIVKLSSNGSLFWNTFMGGLGNDEGYGIALKADKYYVTGESSKTWGTPIVDVTGSSDSFVAKGDNGAPVVASITRLDPSPTNLDSVKFSVHFSENVTGVNAGDFKITKTGLTGVSIASVVGSGDTYTVTVNTGSGNGTIRLDVVDNNSIVDAESNALGGPTAGDGDFSTGEEYSVLKSVAKPGIPTLLSPAKAVMVTTLQPTLDWRNTTPPAQYYQVQVADNDTFLWPAIDETDILTSIFTPPSSLTPGKLYYWRVRAFNELDIGSNWSAMWNFKTPLAKPVLVSPLQAESLLIDRPDFVWEAVAGAENYQLHVSVLKDFSKLLVNTTLDTAGYTMTKDLPQKRTLYWRVRAKTSSVTGPWSARWNFKTGNPPSIPVLAAPANNALIKDYTPTLDWKNSTVPTGTRLKHYELQVDDTVDFSSPEVSVTCPQSICTLLSELDSNTTFFWRVRAVNTGGHLSAWSSVRSFRTVIQSPQALQMVPNPENPLQPTFTWDAAIGSGVITNYTIQLSIFADYRTFLVNSTTNAPTYTMLKDLPSNRTIYVRVRVNGANGPSGWTKIQFKTP